MTISTLHGACSTRALDPDPVWSKNLKHLLAQCLLHGAEARALGS